MSRIKEMMEMLQQKRDELKVQIHLGSMEVKEEWGNLERKWETLSSKAAKELDEGTKALGDELDVLEQDLKNGYESIKKKLF